MRKSIAVILRLLSENKNLGPVLSLKHAGGICTRVRRRGWGRRGKFSFIPLKEELILVLNSSWPSRQKAQKKKAIKLGEIESRSFIH